MLLSTITLFDDISLLSEDDVILVSHKSADNLYVSNKAKVSSLPFIQEDLYATSKQAGIVKVGSGLSVDNNSHTLNVDYSNMPIATSSLLGGITVGSGLSVDNGKVSVPTVTTSANGLMTKEDKQKLESFEENKQDKLFGRLGEIAYLKSDDIIKQELLANNTYVCLNDEEIQICKNNEILFKDVYENWVKVANNGNGVWYGYTPNYPVDGSTTNPQAYGIKKWYYDSEKDTIVQPNNVNDTEGFVSNEKYKNFDITVRCYSTNNDDDFIGVIAGYAIDKNLNMPCMIAFSRVPKNSPSNTGTFENLENFLNYIGKTRWVLKKFYPTASSIVDNTNKLPTREAETLSSDILSNLHVGQTDYKLFRGWKVLGQGCLIRVKRVNDMLSAWTTPFDIDKTSISLSELTAMVTLDLKSDDKLSSLLEGGAIGYCTYSLSMSMYQNIDFKVEKSIVDTRTNLLSVLNPFTGDWQLCSNVIPMDYVGYGRLITNDLTKKTFYSGNNSFKLIAIKNTDLATMKWSIDTFALSSSILPKIDEALTNYTAYELDGTKIQLKNMKLVKYHAIYEDKTAEPFDFYVFKPIS